MRPPTMSGHEQGQWNQMPRSWEHAVHRLLFGLPDVVFAADLEGRFIYLSPNAETIFGVPPAGVIGTTLWDAVVAEDRDKARSIVRLQPYHVCDMHLRIKWSGTEEKYVRFRCKPVVHDCDRVIGYRGLLLECSSTERLQQKLQSARLALQRKSQTINDLNEHVAQGEQYRAIATHIAEIAHELKQPLTVIGGFARRMADRLGSYEQLDPETKPECFNIIQRELLRLEEMLVGLMGVARKHTVHYEETDPNEMINAVLEINEERLKEKALEVKGNLNESVQGVYLDPHLFEHVVRNILTNAIEASPEEGAICIETRVGDAETREEYDQGGGSWFEMKVGNSGNAIPPEAMEKIFEPFYSTKPRGTGIGLTLALHIVREHHGSIGVASDDKRTVFTVRIPAQPRPSGGEELPEEVSSLLSESAEDDSGSR